MEVLILSSKKVKAESSPIPHDFETWTPFYFQNIPVYQNVKGYLEVQPRYSFDPIKTEVLLIRPALYYQWPQQLSTWAGYAVIPYYYPKYILEQRSWEQVQKIFTINNCTVINRFRFEQRYFDNLTGTGIRLRYQIRTLIPIDVQKKWSWAFYDEIFVNANSVAGGGPSAGFDQNRLFAGINHQLTRNIAIEAGYLYQQIDLPNAEVPPVNHIFSCSTYVTF